MTRPSTQAMTDDRLSGLILYTSGLYSKVNEALRRKTAKKGEKTIVDYVQFAASFIQGFRLLPSYWGDCYRGVVWDPSGYTEGSYPVFEYYTSASTDITVAKRFAKSRAITDPKHKRIIFTIHSRSGRSLAEISLYPTEKEIVFRPYTTFLVKKVKEGGEFVEIELEEAYQDIRGRKVLVWIDDFNNKDRKKITNESDKQGVTVVHLHSTQEAKEFFEKHSKLLERGSDKLRIMTDMVRTENGKENKYAGVDFALHLKELKYSQGILCFTGHGFYKEKCEKFIQSGLPNVYVTYSLKDAQNFASFSDLPGSLPDYSSNTKTIKSVEISTTQQKTDS